MKLFTFYYYSIFEIMVRGFPDEDPHRLTLKDTSFPIALCFTMLFMLFAFKTELWFYVISIWDPDYARGGKYNPLSPSSILFLICWFVTAKVTKLYLQRSSVQTEMLAYYRIDNIHTNKYDIHGRLLTVFLFLAPLLTGGLGLYFGWYSAIPLILSIITIEIWIRKEFENNMNSG